MVGASFSQPPPLLPVSRRSCVVCTGFPQASRLQRPAARRNVEGAQAAATTVPSQPLTREARPFPQEEKSRWVAAMQMGNKPPELSELIAELGRAYDPERLAAVLQDRWFEVNTRAARVAVSLGSFAARVAKDAALGQFEKNMGRRAKELRRLLSQLGPSFVKVGQALSARPDLLPAPYLEALSELQDRLPSFPTTTAMALLEAELGQPVGSLYSEITPEPVAAASLGQVYKARIRATGEEVAVKVQRPGIVDNILIDMLLLRRLMKAVDRALPSVNWQGRSIAQPLTPLVDEFAGRLFGELDYIAEGHHCEKFEELYGMVPRIRTPRVYWELTSRKVITLEWVDGVKLTDKDAMAAAGLSVTDFVDVGIECTLRQLLEHGYFHADPHPGNLLACRNGDLCYLDFGMMSEAPQAARYALIAHVVHLVNKDFKAMCRDYYALEFIDRSIDTSPIAPALAEFFDDVLDTNVSNLNFKAIVDGLGDVLFQYPFRVPAYYALILRSLSVLEGLALSADRNYKLLARAYPYMARRLLTDPSPQLRQSFEELILEEGELRWNRMENLLRESRKSMDFDASQLWLLLDWLVSDQGRSIRGPLASDLVRLLDASTAESVRQRARQAGAGSGLVDRLVPTHAADQQTAQRATLLWGSLRQQLANAGVPVESLPGNNVGGAPPAADVRKALTQLSTTLSQAWPRLQAALQQPGAREMQSAIYSGLTQRAAARFVQLIFGPRADTSRSKPTDGVARAAGPSIAVSPKQVGSSPSAVVVQPSMAQLSSSRPSVSATRMR
ncbi:hypothetical protein WJX74_007919 [Apatococcus lobatus]|uniref:Protein kinase domain-containing protein n=2 Tax=Apatococcus TaxID=904362 RepID=A0AAW1SZA9_9CHLO